MKLSSREARAFVRRPDPGVGAVLLGGPDGARVALARERIVAALVGPAGEAEMRLARLGGAEVRRDPALLLDAIKAQGFFPGPRAVLLEDATDGTAPAIAAALDAQGPADARIVATAGDLTARGALRRLFEARRGVVAITLYDDPPEAAEVAAMVREAGLGAVDPAAIEDLVALAQQLDAGAFRDLLERLALHQQGEASPLSAQVARALAPETGGDLDDLVAAVSEGRPEAAASLMALLWTRGVGPVDVAIRLGRHVRAVLAVTSHPGGPAAGLAALRPPIGGAARQAVQRAAAAWERGRAEEALRLLVTLDLTLRSSAPAPERALVERAVLRLARPSRSG